MNAAGRRQKQAKKKYRHIGKMRRPKYSVMSEAKSRRRELRKVEKQRLMASRKKT